MAEDGKGESPKSIEIPRVAAGFQAGFANSRLLRLFKRNAGLLLAAAILAIALLIVFNFLFSKSFTVSCSDYCQSQPHTMCVGSWNITGDYPNCNCRFDCWGTKTCGGDNGCGSNERCYRSYSSGVQAGDMLCHSICNSSIDCPTITPYCRLVNITIGSSSDLVDMCMMDECANDADCTQPRCIGTRAACINGVCRIVDMNGLPARCG